MYNIFLTLCTNLAVSTQTISIIAVIEVTIAMPILVVVELTLAKVTKEINGHWSTIREYKRDLKPIFNDNMQY